MTEINMIGGDGSKRRDGDVKSFDLATFQRLRLDRLDNQRRAEERRMREDIKRLGWGLANGTLPVGAVKNSSTAEDTGMSNSIESDAGTGDKTSAREELLQLGKHYASISRSAQSAKADSQPGAYPSPTHVADISQNGANIPMPSFELNGRESSTPIQVHSRQSTPSLLDKDAGVYGIHYLLLARANVTSPPAQASNAGRSISVDDNNHADDGSSSASSDLTPTLNFQHDEQRDAVAERFSSFCKAQVLINNIEDRTSSRINLVSSGRVNNQSNRMIGACKICDKKLLTRLVRYLLVCTIGAVLFFCGRCSVRWYNLNSPQLRTLVSFQWDHALSVCKDTASAITSNAPSWLNSLLDSLTSLQEKFHSIITTGRELSSTLWGYLISRLILFAKIVQKTIIDGYHDWKQMTLHPWSLESVEDDLFSKMSDGAKHVSSLYDDATSQVKAFFVDRINQASSFYGQATSHLILSLHILRGIACNTWEDLTKDIDVLSWTLHNYYRLEKMYYDALHIYNTTKYRLWELQDASVCAWGASWSLAIKSCQQFDTVSIGHPFYKSSKQIIITKSAITTPILSPHWIPENETIAIFNGGESADNISESSPPEFWRSIIIGTPFIRRQLPSMRPDLRRCLHSLPSLGPPDGTETLTKRIANSQTAPDLQRRNKMTLNPVSGPRHPPLMLASHRIDDISISSDVCKYIAEILAEKRRSRQKHSEVSAEHRLKKVVPKARDYYSSSYPTQGVGGHEKDVFDEVDVMSMAREFISQILQRNSYISRKRRRRSRLQ